MKLPLKHQEAALQRRFEQCLEYEAGKDLAIALHDYVELIENNPELDYLLSEKIQESPKKLTKEMETLSVKALDDLDKLYEKLQKKLPKGVKKENIFTEDGFRVKYEDYRTGKVTSSNGMLGSCAFVLEQAIEKLFSTGSKSRKLIEPLVDIRKVGDREFIEKYKLSDALDQYRVKQSDFDNQLEVMPWGGFEAIFRCYLAVEAFKGNLELVEGKLKDRTFENVHFYKGAFEVLVDRFPNTHREKPGSNFLFFQYSKPRMKRLHYALVEELLWFQEQDETEQAKYVAKITGIKQYTTSVDKKIRTVVFLRPRSKNGNYSMVVNDTEKKQIRKSSYAIKTIIDHLEEPTKPIPYDKKKLEYLNYDANNQFFGGDKEKRTIIVKKSNDTLELNHEEISFKVMDAHSYQAIQTKKHNVKTS